MFDIHLCSYRSIEELRKDAVDTICALAVAMGADFAIFVPSVRKPMLRHHVHVGHFFYKLVTDLYSVPSMFSYLERYELANIERLWSVSWTACTIWCFGGSFEEKRTSTHGCAFSSSNRVPCNCSWKPTHVSIISQPWLGWRSFRYRESWSLWKFTAATGAMRPILYCWFLYISVLSGCCSQ